jgi:hypothetical protein
MALTKEELDDKLCDYCPLEKKGAYNNNGGSVAGCEGSDCDEAYEVYLQKCEGKTFERDTANELLPHVSNAKRTVCAHKWERIGGMDRENYRCPKCGAIT